jgi:hypothetical protein
MMWGYYDNGWWALAMVLGMIAFWGLVAWVVVAVVRGERRSEGPAPDAPVQPCGLGGGVVGRARVGAQAEQHGDNHHGHHEAQSARRAHETQVCDFTDLPTSRRRHRVW